MFFPHDFKQTYFVYKGIITVLCFEGKLIPCSVQLSVIKL